MPGAHRPQEKPQWNAATDDPLWSLTKRKFAERGRRSPLSAATGPSAVHNGGASVLEYDLVDGGGREAELDGDIVAYSGHAA